MVNIQVEDEGSVVAGMFYQKWRGSEPKLSSCNGDGMFENTWTVRYRGDNLNPSRTIQAFVVRQGKKTSKRVSM
jgi:hypothetical protein